VVELTARLKLTRAVHKEATGLFAVQPLFPRGGVGHHRTRMHLLAFGAEPTVTTRIELGKERKRRQKTKKNKKEKKKKKKAFLKQVPKPPRLLFKPLVQLSRLILGRRSVLCVRVFPSFFFFFSFFLQTLRTAVPSASTEPSQAFAQNGGGNFASAMPKAAFGQQKWENKKKKKKQKGKKKKKEDKIKRLKCRLSRPLRARFDGPI
jgi:hypothetical protein